MVPVPEQHGQAFRTWLFQRGLQSAMQDGWNPDKIATAVGALNDVERAAVRRISGSRGRWVEGDELAAEIGVDSLDLLDQLVVMNETMWEKDLPSLVLIKDLEHSPTGRPRYIMESSIAEDVFRALRRA